MASTRDEAVRTLAEMIRNLPVAMLTTITPRGWLRSRPMVAQSAAFDGDLWFFTSRAAAKAADVRDRREVNLSYVDAPANRFVSVAGVATLVEDHDRARVLWTRAYAAWFPKGLDDPDLVLIRVEPQLAEYWDAGANRMVAIEGIFEPAAGFRAVEPDAGI